MPQVNGVCHSPYLLGTCLNVFCNKMWNCSLVKLWQWEKWKEIPLEEESIFSPSTEAICSRQTKSKGSSHRHFLF